MARLLSAAILLTTLAASTTARAQENAETRARDSFERALAELSVQQYDAAASDFELSYRLRAVPVVLYNLGITYAALHRNAEAVDAFTRWIAHPEAGASESQLTAVRQNIEQLRRAVSQLTLQVTPADAQVVVDGRVRDVGSGPILVDPGAHVIEARAAGFHDLRVDVQTSAGETRAVTLQPERYGAAAVAATLRIAETRAEQVDRMRRTQYALIGAGAIVAVLGLGAAGGLQALGWQLHDDYIARCVIGNAPAPSEGCDALRASRRDQLTGLEIGTYVGFGLAAVGVGIAVAGGVTLLRSPSEAPGPREVRLSLGVGHVGVEGRW